MVEEKNGTITITYRFRFYDKHLDWLFETRILYNKVVKHYYDLLTTYPEWLTISNFNLMRKLEVATIGTKEMQKAKEKASFPFIDFPVIPLYFRRAAINCAIGMARSNILFKAENFFAAPVYYKGMYKERKEDSILLKVYTKEKWKWSRYRFTGRQLPENVEVLSPIIDASQKQAYLQIPIRKQIVGIHPVKEQIKEVEKVLALSFPGNNSIAVGAILRKNGDLEKTMFFQGGLELKAKKKKWKRKWEREIGKEKENCLKKIENLNQFYAHRTSRRIIEFCKANGVTIIVIPNYQKTIDFSKKGYLKTDNFEWIGRRVIRYLKYKAFSEGILVSRVPTYHISDCCNECGAKIKRYNTGHIPSQNYYGGQLFLCPNGHQGNSGLNTARNVGKRFLSYYKEENRKE